MATDAILNILLDVCDGLGSPHGDPPADDAGIALYGHRKHYDDGGEKAETVRATRAAAPSIEAGKVVKEQGRKRPDGHIAADPAFGLSQQELEEVLKPEAFTGLAPEQTLHFVEQVAKPALQPYQGQMAQRTDLRV